MPKTVVSFQFVTGTNPYISDINQNLSITSRFVLPPDIDETGRDAILAAVNGVRTTETAICSDNALGKPRKLEFIRSSGNSMSVAVADKTTLNATATTIKGILDAANGGINPVVCIKLIGEEFLNLNDELGVSYDGTTFAPSHKAPTNALKQNYVTGVIAYEADAANTFGTVVNQGIKQHRSYLNPDGVTEDTPTTQLFLDRVVDFEEKVTGTSAGLRHVRSYVRQRQLIAKIPYGPGDEKLVEHVQQILAQPQVICGDYVGERLITGGNSNSIQ